jgi:hypothetical protein
MAPTTRMTKPRNVHDGPTLDLERYVPAFITFIANKLSNSATVRYQKEGLRGLKWVNLRA